jgi:hypothetical protein
MLVSCNRPRVPSPNFAFSLLCVEIVNEVRIFPSDIVFKMLADVIIILNKYKESC